MKFWYTICASDSSYDNIRPGDKILVDPRVSPKGNDFILSLIKEVKFEVVKLHEYERMENKDRIILGTVTEVRICL